MRAVVCPEPGRLETRQLPLPEPGKRAFYRDVRTPHLGVRVTDTGVKTFVLYRKVEGRPERISIGRFPGTSVEQARRQAEKLNGQIAHDENPASHRRRLRR